MTRTPNAIVIFLALLILVVPIVSAIAYTFLAIALKANLNN